MGYLHGNSQRTEIDSIESGKEKQQFEDIINLNRAFKTLQILGQVLRNFPGSLYGEQKVSLARECYLLGLRAMSMLVNVFSDSHEMLRDALKSHYIETKNIQDNAEAERLANRAIHGLFSFIGFGCIKRVSSSVGTESLKETLKHILRLEPELATIKYIDLAIKLDFFPNFPESEIYSLQEAGEKNQFATFLLHQLVVEHFTMYRSQQKLRQRVCDKLGIKHNLPVMIETSEQ